MMDSCVASLYWWDSNLARHRCYLGRYSGGNRLRPATMAFYASQVKSNTSVNMLEPG